ncbi:MAG: cytochrome-c peroxidase [Helicobacteraceae bacterium]|nr:cytochrome-c peroxidase [Helicobacteraceae bacterium]
MDARGYIRSSTSWAFAAIGAIAIMISAIYVVYFRSPLQKSVAIDSSSIYGADENLSLERRNEPILPIQKPINLDKEKIELGRALFHDTRLSKDDTVSCASCHDLDNGGDDGLKRSIGVENKEGEINAPTVYNSSLFFRQFWDGRAQNLHDQIPGPIENPIEMGSDWKEVLAKLNADGDLVKSFMKIYKSPPNKDNVIDALASFEASLITPSRFDRWLLGEDSALSEAELDGYRLFVQYGCIACHQGEGVGGNLFQRFGVIRAYEKNSPFEKADFGRFNVTGREEDRFVFKVPTLRNIELTAPYFHDASSETLKEAINKMGIYQLGISLPPEDLESIRQFLRALTGEELQ